MKKQIIAAALFSTLSFPSFAAGIYVFADFERNKAEADVEDVSISQSENGYGLGLGYKFNPTWAVEFAYRDMMNFNDDEVYEDVEFHDDTDVSALQLSLLANYPLNEKVNLYGRLGVGKIDIDSKSTASVWGESYSESSSESETKAIFGVGGSYAFTEKLGMRLEYSQFAKIEETTLSSLSIALTYGF